MTHGWQKYRRSPPVVTFWSGVINSPGFTAPSAKPDLVDDIGAFIEKTQHPSNEWG
jgi:hypothetical protein